jgi:hypothetical protein
MDRAASGALSSTRGPAPVARGVIVQIESGVRRLTNSRLRGGREQRNFTAVLSNMYGKDVGVKNPLGVAVASSAVADATTSPNLHEAK